MSATVQPQGNRKFQAWCDECQNGINGTKAQADKWAEEHNQERHEDAK